MSEERSYYEIALTNRQVAFAIGTLLLCVVGAFVAGLWVAREALDGTMATGPRLVRDEGERPFAFFEGSDGAGASETGERESGSPAPESAPPEIPVQRVRTDAAADPAPPVTEAGEPAAARARVEIPAEVSADGDPSPRAPQPEDPADETSSREEPVVRASQPEPATSTTGDVVIQVFSSADGEQAEALVARLEQAGYAAFVDPLDNGTRTMFRVRVGPYASRELADAAAAELRREFRLETWITSP